MKNKKIITIIGARPQFIKAAPLSALLRKNFQEIIIHTGQHYDQNMSDIFFKELQIPTPDYNLNIGSSSHAKQTGEMLIAIEDILEKEKPDAVIVFGDTNSTMAGAISAAKLNIPVIHIEAGLRSFDNRMPEEINRIVTDKISSILFAPTKTAVKNLKNEGITDNVYLVGDIMYDSILKYIKIAESNSNILKALNINPKEYLFLTLHRASLTDNADFLKNLIKIIGSCKNNWIFPIHPRTKKYLQNYGLWDKIISINNLKIIDPVGYLDALMLIKNAAKVITDSGGIQKEAYLLNSPCITVRENTEWVETVKAGWNILTGYDKEKIIDAIKNFAPTSRQPNIFGDGNTAKKIIDILRKNKLCEY